MLIDELIVRVEDPAVLLLLLLLRLLLEKVKELNKLIDLIVLLFSDVVHWSRLVLGEIESEALELNQSLRFLSDRIDGCRIFYCDVCSDQVRRFSWLFLLPKDPSNVLGAILLCEAGIHGESECTSIA